MSKTIVLERQLKNLEKKLTELGMVGNVFGGIQIDIVVVKKKLEDGSIAEAPLCDHNCVVDSDGGYTCPGAFSLNKGLIPNTLAPAYKIVDGIKRTAKAIENSKDYFLGKFFDNYTQEFNIPSHIAHPLKNILRDGGVEVNLFGGNPEIHPEIGEIVPELKKEGYSINLTTTGRRFMREEFAQKIFSDPPHILALSADNFEGLEQIRRLSSLSIEEIKEEWKRISPTAGQHQKIFEAVYAARLAENKVKTLFNIVIHPRNLSSIYDSLGALEKYFPRTLINPYPAQSSFLYEQPVFGDKEITMLEEFVDYMIERQKSQIGKDKIFVPRLHYWLMLKSAFQTYPKEEIFSALSGYDVWKCYRSEGAGRYVQIGASTVPSSNKLAGGHLGCFWNNRAVTGEKKVWDMDVEEIGDYIKGGMMNIAERSDYSCPGCIMPRLNFDLMGLETGMDLKIKPTYLELREKHVGF